MHAVFKNYRMGRINDLFTDLGTLGGVGSDDWLGVLVEGVEPLLDGLHVVVHPAGGLAPLEQPLGHGLVAHLEVEDVGARSDLLFKFLALCNFPEQEEYLCQRVLNDL
jgi:hypothetical protein